MGIAPPRRSFYLAAVAYLAVLATASLGNDWASARGREALQQQQRQPPYPDAPLGTVLYDAGVVWLPHWYDAWWLPDAAIIVLLFVAVALVTQRTDSSDIRRAISDGSWVPQKGATAARSASPPGTVAASASVSPSPSPETTSLLPSDRALLTLPHWSDRVSLLLWSHSYVLLLRWVVSCATVYAGSARCVHQSLLHAPNAGLAFNTGCFDLMFSGHASFSVLVGTYACLCPSWTRAVKVPIMLFALFSAGVNVVVGDHFTADVLVGAYVGASVAALHASQWREQFRSESEVKRLRQMLSP